jgi:hypothetical protein
MLGRSTSLVSWCAAAADVEGEDMHDVDTEAEARWLLDQAGFDLDDVPSATELAEGLGAVDVLEVRDVEVCGMGGVEWLRADGMPGGDVGSRWRPLVRRGLSFVERRFTVLHEIAEWHLRANLRIEPWCCKVKEAICDAIAGALLAPRRAFRRAVEHVGDGLEALAAGFQASETAMALRLGEVLLHPVAVISPKLVRVRGSDWGWPPAEQIRQRAALPSCERIRRECLRDDTARVVLRAA